MPFTPSFYIGLWKVQPAAHKTTGKRVSVWTFDKRGPDMERLGQSAKDRTVEVIKNEVGIILVGTLDETKSCFRRRR